MTVDELRKSPQPPSTGALLQALWHDAHGNWDKAHDLAQDIDTLQGAWVHGYLHLREGDRANAAYWYNRAKQTLPQSTLDAEWERLATHLLHSDPGL